MRDVLKDLFSRSVAVTDTRDSMIDSSFLSLNERTYLRTFHKTERTNTSQDAFAHQSMALANIPPVHIPIGNKGEPIWPSGVVGSITHSRGYAAAAVAKQSDVHSLGLDAEIDEPLSSRVLRRISIESEQEWVKAAASGLIQHPGKFSSPQKKQHIKPGIPLPTNGWVSKKYSSISMKKETPLQPTFKRMALSQK
ncbi:MAG: hypothetical protein CM15mP49_30840 [Actinomycetota bacterium]|nr:MAG: hypothetical protein CM15mP49_30840 [Actinomycetota bacterium]